MLTVPSAYIWTEKYLGNSKNKSLQRLIWIVILKTRTARMLQRNSYQWKTPSKWNQIVAGFHYSPQNCLSPMTFWGKCIMSQPEMMKRWEGESRCRLQTCSLLVSSQSLLICLFIWRIVALVVKKTSSWQLKIVNAAQQNCYLAINHLES